MRKIACKSFERTYEKRTTNPAIKHAINCTLYGKNRRRVFNLKIA